MKRSITGPLVKTLSMVVCLHMAAIQATDAAMAPAGVQATPDAVLKQAQPTAGYAKADARPDAGQRNIDGFTVDARSTLLTGISARTVAMGQELYKALQHAQQASINHDEISLRLDLNKASNIVDRLYTPEEVRAIRRQTSIVRADLGQKGSQLDKKLWLPLQAQLERVRLLIPSDRYKAAKSALLSGRHAIRQGDKSKARKALDQIEESLTIRYALMPLGTIRSDLRSARSVLDPPPPYWEGITEATSSALASIRWIATVSAKGWVSAYLTAIEAGNAIPDRPQLARRLLKKTARNLQRGDTYDLSIYADTLSREKHPSVMDVKGLIAAIGQRVVAL